MSWRLRALRQPKQLSQLTQLLLGQPTLLPLLPLLLGQPKLLRQPIQPKLPPLPTQLLPSLVRQRLQLQLVLLPLPPQQMQLQLVPPPTQLLPSLARQRLQLQLVLGMLAGEPRQPHQQHSRAVAGAAAQSGAPAGFGSPPLQPRRQRPTRPPHSKHNSLQLQMGSSRRPRAIQQLLSHRQTATLLMQLGASNSQHSQNNKQPIQLLNSSSSSSSQCGRQSVGELL